MAVLQIKKYKKIKNETGNIVQVSKTKEEWNKETRNGTMIWYFATRYLINGNNKLYKSKLFALKREAEEQERLFLNDPIEYINTHGKRAKILLPKVLKIHQNKNLNDYFTDFIKYEMEYNKEGTTYGHSKIWIKHYKDELGNLFPKDVTLALTQHIHELLNNKINPRNNNFYATETKNTFHSTLSDFYDYLYKNGLIEYNYAKTVGAFKNPKVNKNKKVKIKYQTLEEYEKFMSVVDDEFWKAFFNFLFWHGCRKGEQRALKIRDIDLEHNTINFHSTFARNKNGSETIGPIKNGKERTISLAEQSKPYISKLINFYKKMDGYTNNWFLFGGPFNTYKNRIERAIKYYYSKLQEKYPNENINLLTHHEFGRHSHATFLLNVGCDRKDIYFIIAQRLGDTEEVIRKTYAKPYEELNNDKTKFLLSNENINEKLNKKGENVT